MSDYSLFLCADPSFASGWGSIIDMGGTMVTYNWSPTPQEADGLARRADALALAEDARVAFGQLQDEIQAR